MKKLIFTLFISILTLQLYGQLKKDNRMIGGTAGFDILIVEDVFDNETLVVLDLRPNFGKFITDNFVAGGKFGVLLLSGEGSTVTFLHVGPFARYYFTPEKTSGSPFAQFGVGYTGGFGEGNSESSAEINAGIGYSVFLNKNVAIEGILGYTYRSNPIGGIDILRGLSNHDIGVNFGIQVFLDGSNE